MNTASAKRRESKLTRAIKYLTHTPGLTASQVGCMVGGGHYYSFTHYTPILEYGVRQGKLVKLLGKPIVGKKDVFRFYVAQS